MLKQFTDWLWSLVVAAFTAVWSLIQDVLISVIGFVADGFATLIGAIPVPGFMQGGLATAWSGMDTGILYLATQTGVPQALAIIGAGYVFRIGRKFATLFQW